MKNLLLFVLTLLLISTVISCESEDVSDLDSVSARSGISPLGDGTGLDIGLTNGITDLQELKFYYIQTLINDYNMINTCSKNRGSVDKSGNGDLISISMNPDVEFGVVITNISNKKITVDAWLDNDLSLSFEQLVEEDVVIAGEFTKDYKTGLLSGYYKMYSTIRVDHPDNIECFYYQE